jgi:thioredoxin reductase
MFVGMNRTVAILGGGPAGLSCALWLQQLGLAPVVMERSPQLGGIQRSSHYVNNYYLGLAGHTGREVAEQFVRHARAADFRVICNARIESITKTAGGFAIRTNDTQIEARAIVVATGQRVRGPEAVAGIHADWSALSEQIGFDPGQTPLLVNQVKNQVVAVVGGGDNAMSTSVMLGESAAHIHLLSRSPLHGFKINQDAVRGLIQAGRLTLNQPAELQRLERSGERILYVFKTSGNSSQTGVADYVCFRLGFAPNTEAVLQLLMAGGLGSLALTPSGHLLTDPFLRTSLPRVYAAGDVTNAENPCVATAVAQGAIAARSLEADLPD